MNPVNQLWIGLSGDAVTGRTPANVRVMAGEMTPERYGLVAHAYQVFCQRKNTSLAKSLVEDRYLQDGSRIRFVSNVGAGSDTLMVWAPVLAPTKQEEIGGFVFRPTNSVNTSYEQAAYKYWGKPFEAINEPLGTPMGTDPFVALIPKWEKSGDTPVLTDQYTKVRGITGTQYGQLDWQGPDPKTDVISWQAQSWDRLTFAADGMPELRWAQWEASTGGSDWSKPDMMVHRARNRGSGRVVFRGMKTLREFTDVELGYGLIDGAAITNFSTGRTLIVVSRSVEYGALKFTFFAAAQNGPVSLGSYTAPVNAVNVHGWYFSKSGSKARCTFASKTDQYAVEATITEAGAAFTVLPASRTTSDITVDLYRIQAPWVPAIQGDGTFTKGAGTITGALADRSPAIYSDFLGDDGVLAYIEDKVVQSPSYSATYTSSDGGKTKSFTRTYTDVEVETALVLQVDGRTETRFVISSTGKNRSGATTQSYTTTTNASGDVLTTTEDTTTSIDGYYSSTSPLDIDARARSAVFYGFYNVPASRTMHRQDVSYPGGSSTIDFTSSGVAADSIEHIKTEAPGKLVRTDTKTVAGYNPNRTFTKPLYGPSQGSGLMLFASDSPITGGSSGLMDTDRAVKCKGLSGWLTNGVNGGSYDMTYGMLRSYYGKVISSSLVWVGGYYQSLGSTDPTEKGVAHIMSATGTNDATELVSINTQPIPWLAKLGVV